jgi:hypothetical protein
MADVAFDALTVACGQVGLNTDTRITQTIGGAPDSKGVHLSDGVIGGAHYTAAVDLRTKATAGSPELSRGQVGSWLIALAQAGFAGWFRAKGELSKDSTPHIHAIYCGVPMKPALESQVQKFFIKKSGLGSNRDIPDDFYPSAEVISALKEMFKARNAAPQRSSALSFKWELIIGTPPKVVMSLIEREGVPFAPVRPWGRMLGFDVLFDKTTRQVKFDGSVLNVPLTFINDVAHAPVEALAASAGLTAELDRARLQVVVTR